MKIVFMGTPDFAQESLKSLLNNGYKVDLVITNPDKPKGRGMKMVQSPVKEYAISKGIQVENPEKIRGNSEILEKIRKINPDIICVVAYGKILPKEILDIPKLGCINVHGSLLPKYRGAAPIQWSIINGDKITGITTMYMDVGMDTGDMILKEEVEIGENETTGELWDRLSKIGGKLLVKTLKEIENGTVARIKQPNEFTMAPMLNKTIAKIDWKNKTALQIKNLIRGLDPIIGAYTYINGKKIKIWKAEMYSKEEFFKKFEEIREYSNKLENICPGTVIFSDDKKGLWIKANDGILSVLEIQGENAKRMSVNDFLRGNAIQAGTILN